MQEDAPGKEGKMPCQQSRAIWRLQEDTGGRDGGRTHVRPFHPSAHLPPLTVCMRHEGTWQWGSTVRLLRVELEICFFNIITTLTFFSF